jgi:hypothetical protein
MDAAVPKLEAYRAHASECLREARSTEDREGKQVYHRLAMWWIVLAHQEEDERPMMQSRPRAVRAEVASARKLTDAGHLQRR